MTAARRSRRQRHEASVDPRLIPINAKKGSGTFFALTPEQEKAALSIRVYNTMTRHKEELVPREEGKIAMYVCGPTVYNYVHIGNARTFLNFDMIRRHLEHAGFEVTFVQNVTDVDDKIINRANEEGIKPGDVASKYRQAFEEDMAALGVSPPDLAPRATDHIDEMVEVIEKLVRDGYAYVSEGDVYFEVSKFPGYGKLSGRALEEQQVTAECQAGIDRKRDPYDFALWKAAKPGEPSWDSPWGPGRPGWHIECSTMSMKYLGDGFDIHGGGQDLVFPHHENEIAQAEAYSGGTFVRYWMHSGMLNIDQEKMSKSLGNIKLLREVLAAHSPDTVRMLMLGTHYRSPLSFSDDSLEEARAALERVLNCLFNLDDLIARCDGDRGGAPAAEAEGEGEGETPFMRFLEDSEREFVEAMDDDFNSAAALGVVFGIVREANSRVDRATASMDPAAGPPLLEACRVLRALCGALGLLEPGAAAGGERGHAEVAGAAEKAEDSRPSREELVELLLEARQAAREGRNFELADRIRDGLAGLGVRVEDVRDGYRWRFER